MDSAFYSCAKKTHINIPEEITVCPLCWDAIYLYRYWDWGNRETMGHIGMRFECKSGCDIEDLVDEKNRRRVANWINLNYEKNRQGRWRKKKHANQVSKSERNH